MSDICSICGMPIAFGETECSRCGGDGIPGGRIKKDYPTADSKEIILSKIEDGENSCYSCKWFDGTERNGSLVGYCTMHDVHIHKGCTDGTCGEYEEEAEEQSRIPGVGPNVPTVTNDKGGMQSHTPYGFHLLAPRAMFSMSAVMAEGAKKYAPDNWRKISVLEHLNHAMQHIFAYMAGDTQENHLAHAHCRIMMASELEECGEGE